MIVLDNFQMTLWLIPLALQPMIALSMIRRGQVATLAMFFFYTLLVCGRDFVLLIFRANKPVYAWIYWWGEPLAVLLGLAAICEALWQLIAYYPILRRLGGPLITGALMIAGISGVFLLKSSSFAKSVVSVQSARLLERSAWFVEVGVLIIFVIFISYLGLDWKQYGTGIVAGFGISAGLQLAFVELESLHLISTTIFPLLRSAGYDCAVLTWSAYLLPKRRPTIQPVNLQRDDLLQVDALLRTYLSQ